MEELLEKVRNTQNILLALDIAFLLLDEAIGAFQYADDSNGEIGSLVTETIGLVEEIAVGIDASDVNLRERVFNKLLGQSDSKVFDEWDEYRIDMLRLCVKFADVEEFREKLRMKIEYLVDKNSDNNYNKYSNESMLRILFDIVCEIIEKYKKIAGKKKQECMINELSALYRKRPAFLDELSKVR
ncbi:hypothetical protein ACJDU8_19445 [Clostridium sp. WILCCON 0269]|uniref:Uncharacterized protein n=1 Tax=Candidatus Clostridium eludens TaxID=3381663 RepID=A0ABW8SRC5_9CLOT